MILMLLYSMWSWGEATNSPELGVLSTTPYAHNVHSKMDKYSLSLSLASNTRDPFDLYVDLSITKIKQCRIRPWNDQSLTTA